MATPGMPPMPADDSAGPQTSGYGAQPPASASAPRSGIRAKLGGIMGTLLGWKHQEEIWKKHEDATYMSTQLHDYATNPYSPVTKEAAEQMATKLDNMLGTEGYIKNHIQNVQAQKKVADKIQYHNSTQPVPQAAPLTTAQVGTAVAGPQQPAADDAGPVTPAAAMPTQPQAAPPPQAPPNIPPYLRPNAPPPGAPPGAPPGMPPIPTGTQPNFPGGAGNTGAPAPPPLVNENPEVKTMADNRGAGFQLPPPPDDSAGPQVPPPVPALIGSPSRFLTAEQRGRNAAAMQRPVEEQTNALAIQREKALYEQKRTAEIAEQQRKLALLTSDPAFQKLNPLQQQEVKMRVMGVTGQMSNYARPMNLPGTPIKGSDFAPGSLGVDGQPIDPTKWYKQQAAVDGSGEVRGIPTTPTLTKRNVLTEAGPVIAMVDPNGDVFKAVKEIDGSPITDPRLLATVRSGVSAQKVTTVDKDNNVVTEWVNTPSSSSAQRVLPGKGPRGLPAMSGGEAAPDGNGGGAAPSARANSLPTPRPQPLTAATRKSVEYAKEIQQHIPRIESLMKSLDDTGDLGTIASRWNEFKTGKLGAGDPRYAALRADMTLLSTALGVVHQTRGSAMAKHFMDLNDAGKMDYNTLKGGFDEVKSWMDGYAKMGSNRPGAVGGQAPPARLTRPPLSTYHQ